MIDDYRVTKTACYLGYAVQAIVVILPSLLFITFQNEFGIPLATVSVLVAVNFLVQLAADMVAPFLLRKFGYRNCFAAACVLVILFLVGLVWLPSVIQPAILGAGFAVALGAIGGGLIEVMIGPIINACPYKNKEAAMSLLHSFYCWGCCIVILGSALFFLCEGTEQWRILCFLWILLPLVDLLLLFHMRLPELETAFPSKIEHVPWKPVLLTMIIMLCAGACEHIMSQWASTIAELELGWSKTAGDLACPFLFAVFMGLGRAILPRMAKRWSVLTFLIAMCLGCAIAYLMIALGTGFMIMCGFVIGGFCVASIWPYTCSMAAEHIHLVESLLFAFMAVAGDIGCALGPVAVGQLHKVTALSLKQAELLGIIFAFLAMFLLILEFRNINSTTGKEM